MNIFNSNTLSFFPRKNATQLKTLIKSFLKYVKLLNSISPFFHSFNYRRLQSCTDINIKKLDSIFISNRDHRFMTLMHKIQVQVCIKTKTGSNHLNKPIVHTNLQNLKSQSPTIIFEQSRAYNQQRHQDAEKLYETRAGRDFLFVRLGSVAVIFTFFEK